MNATIQRLPTNSTNTLKFNDNRENRKLPLWISRRSGTFLFQKLECNREQPLYSGFPTVVDKKEKTDYSIKIVSLIWVITYILIEFYLGGATYIKWGEIKKAFHILDAWLRNQ